MRRPDAEGFLILPDLLNESAQAALLAEVRNLAEIAPFDHFVMPGTGRPFSAAMTNAGSHGWIADQHSYRYTPVQPRSGRPWPPIPPSLLALWQEVSDWPLPPQCCLVNYYQGTGSRLGLHRDEDEEVMDAPILNISLGDTGVFRLGGLRRTDPTRSFRVSSGTVMLFSGRSRLFYHGIDRILPGSSRLLPEGGRINLTLRRVTA